MNKKPDHLKIKLVNLRPALRDRKNFAECFAKALANTKTYSPKPKN